jgi:dienelactone hydrolase
VRVVRPHLPDRSGRTDGLAWTLFEPRTGSTMGGVVVLHGAGSRKESHHDYARACASMGLAALCFDARGHGASEGAMGAGALDDVAVMAAGDHQQPLRIPGRLEDRTRDGDRHRLVALGVEQQQRG